MHEKPVSHTLENDRNGSVDLEQKEERKTDIAKTETIAKSLVPQSATSKTETTHKQDVTGKMTQAKQIVTAPSIDVSKWKKYAGTYYKRSLKKVPENWPQKKREISLNAVNENKEKYYQYKSLLETSGIKVIEKKNRLIFE